MHHVWRLSPFTHLFYNEHICNILFQAPSVRDNGAFCRLTVRKIPLRHWCRSLASPWSVLYPSPSPVAIHQESDYCSRFWCSTLYPAVNCPTLLLVEGMAGSLVFDWAVRIRCSSLNTNRLIGVVKNYVLSQKSVLARRHRFTCENSIPKATGMWMTRRLLGLRTTSFARY